MFSGDDRSDEKLRSASALLHGIVSKSRTSRSTLSNILRTISCAQCAEASFVETSSTDSNFQFLRQTGQHPFLDMQIQRSSVHQHSCPQSSERLPVVLAVMTIT